MLNGCLTLSDKSFVGQGTPPRPVDIVNRLCVNGSSNWIACPGSVYNGPEEFYQNQRIVNSSIPDADVEAFSSGTIDSTICGPMEIQWRNYKSRVDPWVDGGAPQQLANFLAFDSFILDDAYTLIEGAIVDSKDGGIGLRNHTMPSDLSDGATWSEDILWLTPVTACTDTNLTYGFELPTQRVVNSLAFTETTVFNVNLTDHGGFSGIPAKPPGASWSTGDGPDAVWRLANPNPDLQQRSSEAAWYSNKLMMLALNITDPHLGDVYLDNFYNYTQNRNPSAVQITLMTVAYIINSSAFGDGSKIRSIDFQYYGK